MGTPDFAVASLKRLVEDGHEICGVFTQPDRPKNRGHKLAFSPVKEYALAQGLSVYQPTKMRDGTALALVRELHPELIVVAAYGRILPEDILNTPPYGSINVHSSLLPKYRGAAPINWAILNGERETGVTIMYMAKELDAGDILHVLKTDIDPQEDAQTLTARLAELGAQALSETVEQLRAGTAHRTVQDHSAYTYAPMLTKDMGVIDWTKPAGHIHNQVRGLIPWPCASTELGGATVKIFRTEVLGETGKAPGAVAAAGKAGIDVACGDGHLLRILELQPQGGRRMAAADYLRGMGASGLGVEAAARTAAVLSTGAEGAIPLKEGYAAAMAAQNTSYACVEKNIRSMVGKLQAGACGEYQALMGGLPAERPSNELFLRRLARRILEW